MPHAVERVKRARDRQRPVRGGVFHRELQGAMATVEYSTFSTASFIAIFAVRPSTASSIGSQLSRENGRA
jgi:hypothetical protein